MNETNDDSVQSAGKTQVSTRGIVTRAEEMSRASAEVKTSFSHLPTDAVRPFKRRTIVQTILICFFAPTIVLFAQEESSAAASPVTQLIEENEELYDGIRKIVHRSAEIMPEENYAFRPTDVVRSFGQIVGHVADAQYIFCSRVLGEPNPAPKVEQTVSSKADLIAALDESFAYCDRAYSALTDTNAIEKVNLMGSEKTKLGVLSVNQVHTIEHYGNLVTYLRMNDIVPPTSDREFMQQLQKR